MAKTHSSFKSTAELNIPSLILYRRNLKSGLRCWVLVRKKKWNPQLKKNKIIYQETVGSFPLGQETGRIAFTKAFLEKYPILKEVEVVRLENGKYAYCKLDRRTTESKNISTHENLALKRGRARYVPPKEECVGKSKQIGVSLAVEQSLDSIGMLSILKEYLEEGVFQQLLTAICLMISEDKSTFNTIEEFVERCWVPIANMTNEKCTMLFKKLDGSVISNILQDFSRHTMKLCPNKHFMVSVDGTSITTLSKKAPYAEYGHNKDGDKEKQINLMFVHAMESDLTLCYRMYPGNASDMSAFPNTRDTFLGYIEDLVKKSNAYRDREKQIIPEVTFVFDRGFTSLANIFSVMDSNAKFIGNISTHTALGKDAVIAAIKAGICRCSSRQINLYNNTFHHQTTVTDREHGDLYLHAFYSKKVQRDLEDRLVQEATSLLEECRARPQDAEILLKGNEQLFKIRKGSNDYDLNYPNIVRLSNERAFKVLGTNILPKDITPEELDDIYRRRNNIEIAFSHFKETLEGNRFNTGNAETLKGKAFAMYLALLVCQVLSKKMNEAYQRVLKAQNISYQTKEYLKSLPKFISMLKNINATMNKDGNLVVDEVVGYKREILDLLDIKLYNKEINLCGKIEVSEDIAANYDAQDAREEGLYIKNDKAGQCNTQ